ncbi:putative integral membrane protein [Theileria parva strain Muguga]|uniref:Cytochrome c oxidase subunit II, putative n=1 Tax=Theileria parva TaxID=5875 RepID=Q4N9M1_THEPA|nr:putative integral membrane protein [Theileria parva strain Muguga]EAN33337.1 putative integral membrane protein [Theileria parva strain Muguga]|eukprot:XP_765620.1 cytochrome c oxidase subunit II precursor [Theileria parva strain Muguga]
MLTYSGITRRLFQSSLLKNTKFQTPQSHFGILYPNHEISQRHIFTSRLLLFTTKKEPEANNSTSDESSSVNMKNQKQFTHVSETFGPGKYRGTGLPKPVGQPEDLPSIEFGKPTGMYNFVRHQHGDPRDHLREDGRFKEKYATDGFHWYDAYTDVPKQRRTIVNGEAMVLGVETRPMEELFGVEQTNVPFYHRRRLNLWGDHKNALRAEFCFFWIPTFIIFSLAIPCYTMLYMLDESVYTTMTVKVIGHQWYWVYEVESPPV